MIALILKKLLLFRPLLSKDIHVDSEFAVFCENVAKNRWPLLSSMRTLSSAELFCHLQIAWGRIESESHLRIVAGKSYSLVKISDIGVCPGCVDHGKSHP